MSPSQQGHMMSSSGEHIKHSSAQHLSSKDTPHFSENTLHAPKVICRRRLLHERPFNDLLPVLGQCYDWACGAVPRKRKEKPAFIMILAGSTNGFNEWRSADCQTMMLSSPSGRDALGRREFGAGRHLLHPPIEIPMCFIVTCL